ncbi:hypothetical protein Tco_0469487, partial [Tanacetum coccineum]
MRHYYKICILKTIYEASKDLVQTKDEDICVHKLFPNGSCVATYETEEPDKENDQDSSWITIPPEYSVIPDETGLSQLIDFIYDDATLKTPTARALQQKALKKNVRYQYRIPENRTRELHTRKYLTKSSFLCRILPLPFKSFIFHTSKVNSVRPNLNTGRTNISYGRSKVNTVSPKVNYVSPKVNTVRPRQTSIAQMAHANAVMGSWGSAVK